MSTNRRLWLKQSSLALAGLTFSTKSLIAGNSHLSSPPEILPMPKPKLIPAKMYSPTISILSKQMKAGLL